MLNRLTHQTRAPDTPNPTHNPPVSGARAFTKKDRKLNMSLVLDRIGNERHAVHLQWLAERSLLPPSDEQLLVLDPPFQRGQVWSDKQKEAWIESILLDLPLPAMFINRFGTRETHPKYGHRDVVIDGQQRLRATGSFLRDGFRVRGELWSEQSEEFKRLFKMNVVVPVIYMSYDSEVQCAELYLKLLTAGTAHTPEEIKKAKNFLRTHKSAKTRKDRT